MENQAAKYKKARDIFMETFSGDTVMSVTIPEVARKLFRDEFAINIYDNSYIPIVFSIGWTEILKFVKAQPSEQFAIDICGISLEYTTEFSESDKSTNIVPQLIHKRNPIFIKQEHQNVIGSSYNDELLSKYNSWRSVNLTETVDKIERDVFSIILNDYGIDLMVTATILPLMSAIYAAGLQIAKETGKKVNMYNIFEISIVDEHIILTGLAPIKQWCKGDSKTK